MKTLAAALLVILPLVVHAEEPAVVPPAEAATPAPAPPAPPVVVSTAPQRHEPPQPPSAPSSEPSTKLEGGTYLPWNSLATGSKRLGFAFAQLTGTNIGFTYFLSPQLAIDLNAGFQVVLGSSNAFGFSIAPGLYSYLANIQGRAVPFLHGYLEFANPVGRSISDSHASVGLNFGAEFFIFRELSVSGELGAAIVAGFSPVAVQAGTTGRGAVGVNLYF